MYNNAKSGMVGNSHELEDECSIVNRPTET